MIYSNKRLQLNYCLSALEMNVQNSTTDNMFTVPKSSNHMGNWCYKPNGDSVTKQWNTNTKLFFLKK